MGLIILAEGKFDDGLSLGRRLGATHVDRAKVAGAHLWLDH